MMLPLNMAQLFKGDGSPARRPWLILNVRLHRILGTMAKRLNTDRAQKQLLDSLNDRLAALQRDRVEALSAEPTCMRDRVWIAVVRGEEVTGAENGRYARPQNSPNFLSREAAS